MTLLVMNRNPKIKLTAENHGPNKQTNKQKGGQHLVLNLNTTSLIVYVVGHVAFSLLCRDFQVQVVQKYILWFAEVSF